MILYEPLNLRVKTSRRFCTLIELQTGQLHSGIFFASAAQPISISAVFRALVPFVNGGLCPLGFPSGNAIIKQH